MNPDDKDIDIAVQIAAAKALSEQVSANLLALRDTIDASLVEIRLLQGQEEKP